MMTTLTQMRLSTPGIEKKFSADESNDDEVKISLDAEDEEEESDDDNEHDEEEEKEDKKTKKLETAADSSLSHSNDPVRIYLRKMGSVALLSREGEVVIAKKIEAAENLILNKLIHLDLGLSIITQTAYKYLDGEIRMKSWIKGFDDDESSNNEEVHEEKIKQLTQELFNSFLKTTKTKKQTWKNSSSEKRASRENV